MDTAPGVQTPGLGRRAWALGLPNLLATRKGRLAAFFLLYVTEGIPLGFAATAVAYYLRKSGVSPAEIGAFVGSIYVPWAFKWAFGPLIDVFRSCRLGHRRAWILGTQLMMSITLAGLVVFRLPEQLAFFTALLFVHNTFSAMQDVAIDALAVNTLHEDERGLANGLMFAGASVGQTIGGLGVLFVAAYTGFSDLHGLRCAPIRAVTFFVAWPMNEGRSRRRPSPRRDAACGAPRGRRASSRVDFFRASSRRAGRSPVSASRCCPPAPWRWTAPASNPRRTRLDADRRPAAPAWNGDYFVVAMVAAVALGQAGRRRTLFVDLALMSLPSLLLACGCSSLATSCRVLPRGRWCGIGARHAPWIASLVYVVFMGLTYGMLNVIMTTSRTESPVATSSPRHGDGQLDRYSANWQGHGSRGAGHPKTDGGRRLGRYALLLNRRADPCRGRLGAPARRASRTAARSSRPAWSPVHARPGNPLAPRA